MVSEKDVVESRTRAVRRAVAAILVVAVAGGIGVWMRASYEPTGGLCAAVYPMPRACNTGLRQQWAVSWIAALALVAVAALVAQFSTRMRRTKVWWGVLAAELALVGGALWAGGP